MNYFDSEKRIIDHLQAVRLTDVSFVNVSLSLARFFLSLYLIRYSRYWIDSSSKSDLPPDFYNDRKRYMLEVMRLDDYEEGSSHPNSLEGKAYSRYERIMREHGKTLRNATVMINPSMENVSDNNLDIYFSNFKRIVGNHAEKTKNYRNNHKGYKLGFLIFDESPAYVETEKKLNNLPKAGDTTGPSRYYHAPYDKRLLDYLVQFDIDYVIWMTPYKWIPMNPRTGIKEVYLLDIKKARKKAVKCINYEYDNIICLEAE